MSKYNITNKRKKNHFILFHDDLTIFVNPSLNWSTRLTHTNILFLTHQALAEYVIIIFALGVRSSARKRQQQTTVVHWEVAWWVIKFARLVTFRFDYYSIIVTLLELAVWIINFVCFKYNPTSNLSQKLKKIYTLLAIDTSYFKMHGNLKPICEKLSIGLKPWTIYAAIYSKVMA